MSKSIFWRNLSRFVAGGALLCSAYIDDAIRDGGLTLGQTGSTFQIVLCNAEPDTYTEAFTTFKVGTKTSPSLSLVAGTGGGRAIQCLAFTDGAISATDTASHWAEIDTTNSRLVAAGALAAPQSVTNLNPFSLGTFQVARWGNAT